MGGNNSKLCYRNVVIQLTTKTQPVDANDNEFWGKFWTDVSITVQDIFVLIPAAEIRALREESPNNLATLSYKAVEKLSQIAEASFPTAKDQQTGPEDMHTIDSCEYIWQAGVGFAQTPISNHVHDSNRAEILKLLLTCFSETMYVDRDEAQSVCNKWVAFFASTSNRHALPLFASLLNVVCAYDPVGFGLPYNYLMFSDAREPLVEVALQVLCIVLEAVPSTQDSPTVRPRAGSLSSRLHSSDEVDEVNSVTGTALTAASRYGDSVVASESNLFANYMSRIHRDEDFAFILSGLTRLLNNPLQQTYLPASTKKVQMHQELLVLFWRTCEINRKFMYYVLKSSQVLDLLVPILYHLNDARSDPARLGLVHVGVFILLLLSGERNFGVRLNKPYKNRVQLDVAVFTGTHADLLIVVFHKLITSGHRRLQPLFDCLLTIIANVSPYLKSLSMVTSNKLVHLLEAFSQPWYMYSGATNYQPVFLLLEVFNNIIQYQFDGNSNLVYTLIRKRQVFYHLANLPTDQTSIQRVLNRRSSRRESDTAFESPLANINHSIPSSPTTHPTNKKSQPLTDASSKASSGTAEEEADQTASIDEIKTHSVGPSTKVEDSSLASVNGDPTSPDSPKMMPTTAGLQTALAETPGLQDMTGKHVANAMPLSSHMTSTPNQSTATTADISDGLENTLISHLSPSRRIRSLSDSASSPKREEAGAMVDADGLHAVSLAHPGIAESSLLDDKAMSARCRQLTESKDKRSKPSSIQPIVKQQKQPEQPCDESTITATDWLPTSDWATVWKAKMPFQTIMRLLQVLVPQVEKICIDKGLTDESEIVKFLQNGTLVGLLPVPHPILIRKYQSNAGTAIWFRNYLWGVLYLRNVNPPIWYDTNVRLFEIQRI